jgi:acyl-CoA thioesterase YciA
MTDHDFENDDIPGPAGELALQTVAMPTDTNPRGDIFAGWLMSQMDMAAAITATKVTRARIATVAVGGMNFMSAVQVGAIVSCYGQVINIGSSSITIVVEVWINHKSTFEPIKVTEGEFVFVVVDEKGRTVPIDHH